MRSVHRYAGAGLYRLPACGTTSEIRKGSLIGLLCSQRAYDQNVLPREKARIDAPRVGWVEYCAQWKTNRAFLLERIRLS